MQCKYQQHYKILSGCDKNGAKVKVFRVENAHELLVGLPSVGLHLPGSERQLDSGLGMSLRGPRNRGFPARMAQAAASLSETGRGQGKGTAATGRVPNSRGFHAARGNEQRNTTHSRQHRQKYQDKKKVKGRITNTTQILKIGFLQNKVCCTGSGVTFEYSSCWIRTYVDYYVV